MTVTGSHLVWHRVDKKEKDVNNDLALNCPDIDVTKGRITITTEIFVYFHWLNGNNYYDVR